MPDQKPYPLIDATRCSGCGRCVAACKSRTITLEVNGFRKAAQRRSEVLCTVCKSCLSACPLDAIHLPFNP